ncbi:septum site determining protein [Nocardioides marmoriginsengisoli]|uniref:Septum site determining protein n=1 Tax=Nocardioides marmoriginsengisoli TaxID=661483 RepID=A0A3N0CGP1_9ACTN|nr:septum site-determining protein Ssd [Nocardioides marmoriginsengisoli]RNL62186.1 septum site determining protein [Nocardioides marmoriginsengisoli]
MPVPPAPPLLLTADAALRAELTRLAAAAGVTPDCTGSVVEALRLWSAASVVLVGADLVEEVADAAPVRRSLVHVVGLQEPSDAVYRPALGFGAERVLTLPRAEATVIDLFTDSDDGTSAYGALVGVIGGAGGVGSSIFAAALAQTLGEVGGALLVDADEHGAGVDRILGLGSAFGVRWDALAQSTGRLSARSLREALPRRGGLSVLAWPVDRSFAVSATVTREVLSAGRRGYPVVVVDLPRQPDPVAEEVLRHCDLVLLVCTTTAPAAAAATRVAARVPTSRSWVVLRGGVALGSDVETLLGLPVLRAMADQRGLDEAIGLGLGPLRSRRGPLARAAASAANLVLTLPGAR